jgi:hypothetical protein
LCHGKESELFSQRCLVYFEGWLGMTELDVLDRDISGLKELLRVAWLQLADASLTPFERREARNRITLCSAELRRHLAEAELRKARKQPRPEQGGQGPAKPKLRLLPDGY